MESIIQQPSINRKEKGLVRNSALILFAFATAFFPRILDAIGAPSPINFLHFVTVPIACAVALLTTKSKSPSQNYLSLAILARLFLLVLTMIISAFVNEAGLINVAVHFLLLGEPFLLLLALTSIPIAGLALNRFQYWMLLFCIINLVLFYVQYPMIASGILHAEGFTPQDGAAGVFYVTGAGNYVSASVSVGFALHFWSSRIQIPWWLRALLLGAAFFQVYLSDSKQILLALMVAWVILIVVNSKDIFKTFMWAVAAALSLSAFWWGIYNIEALNSFTSWIRPEMYAPGGAAPYAKFAGLRIATGYFESPLNWLFGLGSGHTIGRLGGWFLRDYWSLLEPMGATVHPVSAETNVFMKTFWLTSLNGSSMFNPFFGWAGIWGDLGFFGLGTYFSLCVLVWQRVCYDSVQKFMVITIFVLGLIFTQMEEPGYMLSIAIILGLRWHENRQVRQDRILRWQQIVPLEANNDDGNYGTALMSHI